MNVGLGRVLGVGFALVVAGAPIASCNGASGPAGLGGLTVDGSVERPEASTVKDAGILACEAGLVVCDGVCTNAQVDPKNCGQCGAPCDMTAVCVGGTCGCAAGMTVCSNTTCTSTATDPANCGECGHNCQGSACLGGLCTPTVVATPGAQVWGIAVNSTTMYWTQLGINGSVDSKPFAGNATTEDVINLADPRGITVDLTNAYWVDYADSTVNQIGLIGGPLTNLYTPIPADAGADAGGGGPVALGPLDVVADGENVYWVANVTGQIASIPIGGAPYATALVTAQDHPVALAVDGKNIYWANQGSSTNPPNGSVNQVAKDGLGAVVPIATGEAQPWDIAIDGKNIYWTDKANPGFVRQAPIGGGPVVTLAQNEGAPYGIAVDTQFVYWTDYDDNTVKRVPIGGGTTFVLASGQNTPAAIAVDTKNVYWVNQGAETIYLVAK